MRTRRLNYQVKLLKKILVNTPAIEIAEQKNKLGRHKATLRRYASYLSVQQCLQLKPFFNENHAIAIRRFLQKFDKNVLINIWYV